MLVILDFDDVIFNTKKFKEDLRNIFLRSGVSWQMYDETYEAPSDKGSGKFYDPRMHLRRLHDCLNFKEDDVAKSVDVLMDDTSRYVFPDIARFIGSFESDQIFILSYGDMDFQKEKIKNCGICESVNAVIVTKKSKSEAIAQLLESKGFDRGEPFVFIDDRMEHLEDVKTVFPHAVTVLCRRPEGRYRNHMDDSCCDYCVEDMSQMSGIMERISGKKADNV